MSPACGTLALMTILTEPANAAGPGWSGAALGSDLLARLTAPPSRRDRLVHAETLPARSARCEPFPGWVPDPLLAALRARGIHQLWSHQAEAADAAWSGQHVVVATGTASGKSLAFWLPSLGAALQARGPKGQRGATTLYLAPTKALAHDQCAGLAGLGLDIRIATHDGDSSPEERAWTRSFADYVLTNPDMLHHSMLPAHSAWADFFRTLRFVVIDECHHYRGVFGAHVAAVLRRLRRVAGLYGASPTFILASATTAEPATTARRLIGQPVRAVARDGSPRGSVTIGLWEPPLTSMVGERGAPVRRAAAAETADLLADLVAEQVRTLAFVRSRQGTEFVAGSAREALDEVHPGLGRTVESYRGGYLPEERRAIEQALRSGKLLGLAATNALELGIDIAGLDAVILAGFPGTRAAFWQQLGRAGRAGQDALGVMVARDDPLDTYLVNHPEALLGAPLEASVFDPGNPHVLGPHLCAAAHEHPLTEADLPLFGPRARDVVDALVTQGLLRARPRGWFWTDRRRPSDLADLRSAGGGPVQLIEGATGRVIGTVDAGRAHGTAHPGAVYVHRGEPWLVEELDLDAGLAVMSPTGSEWSTTAREVTEIAIESELAHQTWGSCRMSFGEVSVTHQVVSFLKRRQPSGEIVAEEPLDLPPRTLLTKGCWWTVPAVALDAAGLLATTSGIDLPGAAHAAEHCSIGLLPLFATCDRWDIGGVSTALHPDTGQLTVFVYDGHPGGAGFAEHGYLIAAEWLRATREAIAACECPDGCPSCVQSPKCGNQNNPLDKSGALLLLDLLLQGAPRG